MRRGRCQAPDVSVPRQRRCMRATALADPGVTGAWHRTGPERRGDAA
jgi:hypothetical protein